MYLQTLEIQGFKSFAKKTRLVFEPGITAIVGPNGCGKSNVCDAIRWVLGEQRPTALRGGSMTDVIFNGTDDHRPMGMAEVSITFVDCEKQLGTEFNEVTITRRVFRTGEGQYFLNRTPCRLRDIQRLFMDTGIGTTSYSVMAQGQIDAILSSRPEDRRAIFEEASGITRFRADRKEAMRKLEATEQNLSRLDDVLHELRRQIGSLQRQAARARRYKEIKAELQTLDLYVAGVQSRALDARAAQLAGELAARKQEAETLRGQVAAAEAHLAEIRREIADFEQTLAEAVAEAAAARAARTQADEKMALNRQRRAETLSWKERDQLEIEQLDAVLEQQKQQQGQAEEACRSTAAEAEQTSQTLQTAREAYDARHGQMEQARTALQQVRMESAAAERSFAEVQNELARAEASARDAVLKKETLTAEQARLSQMEKDLAERLDDASGELETLQSMAEAQRENVSTAEARLHTLRAALAEAQTEVASARADAAACAARIRVLEDAAKAPQGIPGGAARLLAKKNLPETLAPDAVLGLVADQFSAPPALRTALGAALAMWKDAVAVKSAAAFPALLAALTAPERQAATILAGDAAGASAPEPAVPPAPGTQPLLPQVTCPAAFRPAAARLLSRVFVVDTLPDTAPEGTVLVTPGGEVLRDGGLLEIHAGGKGAADPFARHAMLEDARAESGRLAARVEEVETAERQHREALTATEDAISQARALLEQSLRTAARKEGEERSLSRELADTRTRLRDVTARLQALDTSTQNSSSRSKDLAERLEALSTSRQRLADAIAQASADAQSSETLFLQSQTGLTDARLAHAAAQQRAESARSRQSALQTRISELESMTQTRRTRLASYDASIVRIDAETASLAESLAGLDENTRTAEAHVQSLREERLARQADADREDAALQTVRATLEAAVQAQNKTEISVAETTLQKQNLEDRLRRDWDLGVEDLARQPVPDWNGKPEPTPEACAAHVQELRRKLEEMGPVNLIAIEDCQKSEERLTFLSEQEADLKDAKEKLLTLIRDIDRQSVARFQETFTLANENFQRMYTRLFGGGTAELRLLDEADILECGIDIVARPPGKKPQTISLLSGGERTMTAVALLFSIYAIKPSPFAILDELDAALDDSNIGRFVDVLKDFLSLSQFLIVTHNQHTIAGADIVYGVTHQEKGVSTIISMRLKRVGVAEPQAEEIPAPDAPPPPSERKLQNAISGKRRGRKKDVAPAEQSPAEAMPETPPAS